MTSDRKPHPIPDRLRIAYANEHSGLTDYITELEPYVSANPDDKWATGQLRYAKRREKELAELLGRVENRSTRPES